MPRKLSAETIAAIEERGRANVSAQQIARELGVSYNTADRYARIGRSKAATAAAQSTITPYADTPRSIAAGGNGFTLRLTKDVDGLANRVSYSVAILGNRSAQGARFPDLTAQAAISKFVDLYRRHIAPQAAP